MKPAGRFFSLAATLALSVMVTNVPGHGQDASAVYKAKCAMCHGADGKGDTAAGKKTGARDFASAEVQKESDADLEQITKKGKNKMPGYEGKLKESEIKDLVAYVRKLAKGH